MRERLSSAIAGTPTPPLSVCQEEFETNEQDFISLYEPEVDHPPFVLSSRSTSTLTTTAPTVNLENDFNFQGNGNMTLASIPAEFTASLPGLPAPVHSSSLYSQKKEEISLKQEKFDQLEQEFMLQTRDLVYKKHALSKVTEEYNTLQNKVNDLLKTLQPLQENLEQMEKVKIHVDESVNSMTVFLQEMDQTLEVQRQELISERKILSDIVKGNFQAMSFNPSQALITEHNRSSNISMSSDLVLARDVGQQQFTDFTKESWIEKAKKKMESTKLRNIAAPANRIRGTLLDNLPKTPQGSSFIESQHAVNPEQGRGGAFVKLPSSKTKDTSTKNKPTRQSYLSSDSGSDYGSESSRGRATRKAKKKHKRNSSTSSDSFRRNEIRHFSKANTQEIQGTRGVSLSLSKQNDIEKISEDDSASLYLSLPCEPETRDICFRFNKGILSL